MSESTDEADQEASAEAQSCEQAKKSGALRSVLDEWRRQNEMWGVRKHNLATWHAIVSEELGEAAEAILKRKHRKDTESIHIGHVRDEFVQVAATALQVVQYIDREYYTDSNE